jgi:hypothetical protein
MSSWSRESGRLLKEVRVAVRGLGPACDSRSCGDRRSWVDSTKKSGW